MLFSHTEKKWLLGNAKLSEWYERKIKSDIRRKLKIFKNMNLAMLIKKGWFDYHAVTENSNSVIKYSKTQNMLLPSKYYRIENFLASYQQSSN